MRHAVVHTLIRRGDIGIRVTVTTGGLGKQIFRRSVGNGRICGDARYLRRVMDNGGRVSNWVWQVETDQNIAHFVIDHIPFLLVRGELIRPKRVPVRHHPVLVLILAMAGTRVVWVLRIVTPREALAVGRGGIVGEKSVRGFHFPFARGPRIFNDDEHGQAIARVGLVENVLYTILDVSILGVVAATNVVRILPPRRDVFQSHFVKLPFEH